MAAWKVTTPEARAAFRADWARGIPLREMAAMYGYTNINSVTRTARRLGCEPRKGGAPTAASLGIQGEGRWVTVNGIQRWEAA